MSVSNNSPPGMDTSLWEGEKGVFVLNVFSILKTQITEMCFDSVEQ